MSLNQALASLDKESRELYKARHTLEKAGVGIDTENFNAKALELEEAFRQIEKLAEDSGFERNEYNRLVPIQI